MLQRCRLHQWSLNELPKTLFPSDLITNMSCFLRDFCAARITYLLTYLFSSSPSSITQRHVQMRNRPSKQPRDRRKFAVKCSYLRGPHYQFRPSRMSALYKSTNIVAVGMRKKHRVDWRGGSLLLQLLMLLERGRRAAPSSGNWIAVIQSPAD